ncbi:MAG: RnfABCDGE type electron transport complex subunit D [Firmicutes bacterium]|nr:RnfABCDGE type electron transport complex subunit D [Bacillota bacterium]
MTETLTSVQKDALLKKNTYIFTGALAVLLIAAAFIFGYYVLAIAAVSYAVSFVVEILFSKLRKKEFDYGWMVTPLLIALLMPPAIPLWTVGIAAFFGVFFGKNIFGGSGKYIFSPALVGVLFVLISFPAQMATAWIDPQTADFFTGATPLSLFNRGLPFNYSTLDLLMGSTIGTLGETFRLGIIVLGLLLIVLKVSDWRIPLSYLGSFFVITGLAFLISPDSIGKDPVTSLLLGGILFGAFFIAVDPVTAPVTSKGRIVYGIGLGLLTFVIRNFGTFHEGVTFSIIIMNAISPLIDNKTVKEIDVTSEEVAA